MKRSTSTSEISPYKMRPSPIRDQTRKRYFDKEERNVGSNQTTPANKEIGRPESVSMSSYNKSFSKSNMSCNTSPAARSESSASPTAVTPLSAPSSHDFFDVYSNEAFSVVSPLSSSSAASVPPLKGISTILSASTDPKIFDRESIISGTENEPTLLRDSYSYGNIYAKSIDPDELNDELPNTISAKRGCSSFAESNPLYSSPCPSAYVPTTPNTPHFTTPTSFGKMDKLAIFSPAAVSNNPLRRKSEGARNAFVVNNPTMNASNNRENSSDSDLCTPYEFQAQSSGYSTDISSAPISPFVCEELEKFKKMEQQKKKKPESLHEALQSKDDSFDFKWFAETIEKFPDKVKEKDTMGRLPLHYACLMPRSQVAIDVVLLLLNVNPEGLFISDTTEQAFTPLHHYIAHGIREQVILEKIGTILEEVETTIPFVPSTIKENFTATSSYQPYGKSLLTALLALHVLTKEGAADGLKVKVERYEIVRDCVLSVIALFPDQVNLRDETDGFYPLHDALVLECDDEVVLALIESYPDALKVVVRYEEGRGGGLPLHDAIRKGYGVEVISKMVELYPDSLLTSANCYRHPCSSFCGQGYITDSSHGDRAVHLILKSPFYVIQRDKNTASHDHDAVHYHSLQSLIELLLTKYSQTTLSFQERDTDDNLPIHLLLIHHGVAVSSSMIELFLLAFPDSLGMKNKSGFVPLHIAATCIGKIDKSIIMKMITLSPSSLHETSVDGSLPLHVAVAHSVHKPVVTVGMMSGANDVTFEKDEAQFIHSSLEILQMLIESYPESISSVTAFSYLPLHIAIINHVSMPILHFILSQYPAATETRVRYGDFALHLAISVKSSLEVIRFIHGSYPLAIDMMNAYGNLPLHYAILHRCKVEIIQYLLIASTCSATHSSTASNAEGHGRSESLKTKNVYGNLPLHIAVTQQAPIIVVQAILLLYPKACSIKNNHGLLPLHIALTSANASNDIVHALLSCFPEACRTLLGKTDQIYASLPLHAYLLHHPQPALSILQQLISIFPNAINEKCEESGLLPLHIAIRRSLPLEIVTSLLEHNPQTISARTGRMQNNSGDLPVHLALSQQTLCWDLIHHLIEMFPSNLHESDSNGNFPLHLAAKSLFENSSKQLAMAPERLHTFYEILDAEPEIISCGNYDHELCLHILLKSYQTSIDTERFLEVVSRVVDKCNKAVMEANKHGVLPLTLAIKHHVPLPVIKLLTNLTTELVATQVKIPILFDKEKSVRNGLVDQEERVSLLALALLQPTMKSSSGEDLKIASERVEYVVSINPTSIALLTSITYNIPMHIAAHNHVHFENPVEVLKMFHHTFPGGVQEKNTSSLLPLHEALIGGKDKCMLEVICFLVEIFPDSLQFKDELGNYPLHMAIEQSCPLSVISMLLNNFPEAIRETNKSGKLPLHLLLSSKVYSVDIVEILLKAFPEAVNIKDLHENLPLHSAVSNICLLQSSDSSKVLYLLLNQSIEALKQKNASGELPMHLICSVVQDASQDGSAHQCNQFFMKSFDIVLKGWPEACEVHNFKISTPLHLLLKSNCSADLMERMVRQMLEHCPPAGSIRDGSNSFALHIACQYYCGVSLESISDEDDGFDNMSNNGSVNMEKISANGATLGVIEQLILNYPDALNAVNSNRMSPLQLAIKHHSSSFELIELLLTCYRNMNDLTVLQEMDPQGLLPVHLGLVYGCSVEVLQALVTCVPSSIGMLTSEGFSSLSLAVKHRCRYEVVALLLNLDSHQISNKIGYAGNLPLHIAVSLKDGLLEVVRLLISIYPHAVRIQNNDGDLPLHLAVQWHAPLEVIFMLIMVFKEGCRVLNNIGHLPLHVALEHGASPEVIDLLVSNNPESLAMKNREGLLPIEIVMQRESESVRNQQLVVEILRTAEHGFVSPQSPEPACQIKTLPKKKDCEQKRWSISEEAFESLHWYLLRSLLLSSGPHDEAVESELPLLHHSLPSSFLIIDHNISSHEKVKSHSSPHSRIFRALTYLERLTAFVQAINDMIVVHPSKYFDHDAVDGSASLLTSDHAIQALDNAFLEVFGVILPKDSTCFEHELRDLSGIDKKSNILDVPSGVVGAASMHLYLVDEWTMKPSIHGVNLIDWLLQGKIQDLRLFKISLLVYLLYMTVWLQQLAARSPAVTLKVLGLEMSDILAILLPVRNDVSEDDSNRSQREEAIVIARLDLQRKLSQTFDYIRNQDTLVLHCLDRLAQLEQQPRLRLLGRSLRTFQEILKGQSDSVNFKNASQETDNCVDILSSVIKLDVGDGGGQKYLWVSSHESFLQCTEDFCLDRNYWDTMEKLKLRKLMQTTPKNIGETRSECFSSDQWESMLEQFSMIPSSNEVSIAMVNVFKFLKRRFSIRAVVEGLKDVCDVMFGPFGHNVMDPSRLLQSSRTYRVLKTMDDFETDSLADNPVCAARMSPSENEKIDGRKVDLVSILGHFTNEDDGKVSGEAVIRLCLLCASNTAIKLPRLSDNDIALKGDIAEDSVQLIDSSVVNLMNILTVNDLELLLHEKEKYVIDSWLLTASDDEAQLIRDDTRLGQISPVLGSHLLLETLVAASVMLKWLPEDVLHDASSSFDSFSSRSMRAVHRKLQELIRQCGQLVTDPFMTTSHSVKRCEDSLHKYFSKFGILSSGEASTVHWKSGDMICYNFVSIPIHSKNSSTGWCGCEVMDSDDTDGDTATFLKTPFFTLEVSNISIEEAGETKDLPRERKKDMNAYAILKVENKPLHTFTMNLSLNHINQIVAAYWDFLIDHLVTHADGGRHVRGTIKKESKSLIKVMVDYKKLNPSPEFSHILDQASRGLRGERR